MRSLLVVCVYIFGLAGCAATVNQSNFSTQAAQPLEANQVGVKKVVLRITASPQLQTNGDWPDFMEEWEKSMAAAASDAKVGFIFAKRDEDIPIEAGKLVRLKVNDFKYVSQVKRYMLGVMAGNANMDLEAEYVDLSDRKIVGSNKFNTSTSFIQGVFSAATPKQVEAVSGVIIKDVLGLK